MTSLSQWYKVNENDRWVGDQVVCRRGEADSANLVSVDALILHVKLSLKRLQLFNPQSATMLESKHSLTG
jgi:hypothetical protein